MSNKWLIALGISAFAFCCVGFVGLGAVVGVAHYSAKKKAREEEAKLREEEQQRFLEVERKQAQVEAQVVFADPTLPTPEDAGEFNRFFATLNDALNRNDVPAAAKCFDIDRMCKELERFISFDKFSVKDAAGFKNGMRSGLKKQADKSPLISEKFGAMQTSIRHIRWSADRREAIVITLHRTEGNKDMPRRFRWWMVRTGDGWKIYDYENMFIGLRFTRVTSAMFTPEMIERLERDPRFLQPAHVAFRETIACFEREDFDGADRAFAPVRLIAWPSQMQGVIELIEGLILLGRGNAAGSLTRFDKADQLSPGMALTSLARARAYVKLKRDDDALAAIRLYQKEIGPDALSCTLEGAILESQKKYKEAADAYRRALEEIPDYTEAAAGLRRVQRFRR